VELSYGSFGAGEADVAVVRAVFDAFARRDAEAVIAHMAPDGEFVPQGTAREAGRTEPYVGAEGIRRYFADVAAVWDALELAPDDVRSIAGAVVVFGSITGRTGGREVRRRVMWNWRLRDGRVVTMRATDLGPA
jgi:ketosteroid isomerase-like protein